VPGGCPESDAATTDAFIAEAAEYHRLRMVNLLNPRADFPRFQVARFDIERFINAPAPLAEFRLPDGWVRKFTLSAAQASLIEGYLKQFGSAAWGAGRMLTRVRIDDLLRQVELLPADDERSPGTGEIYDPPVVAYG